MDVFETSIQGLLLLKPIIFSDERGFFLESHNHRRFCSAVGEEVDFVQDNHSRSAKNVLRGLHHQTPPFEQGKLVRVVSGEIFDVAVDMRTDSSTFGKWYGVHLSAKNNFQLWMPRGFAHGFLVLSDVADVLYKTTTYREPSAERSIRWDCPKLGIDWPITCRPLLSPKDAEAPPFG